MPSTSMNQFPNQETQDANFTSQNNVSPPSPVLEPQENDMALENNTNNLNSAQ